MSPSAVARPISVIRMQDKGKETSGSPQGEGGCLRPEVTDPRYNPGQHVGLWPFTDEEPGHPGVLRLTVLRRWGEMTHREVPSQYRSAKTGVRNRLQ